MNALIFDLDGTLWDATEALRVLWEREMGRIGIPRKLTLQHMIGGMGLGPEALAAHMVPELPMEQRVPFFRHVTQVETEFIPQYGATLYPGMVPTLRQLAQDYAILIASNCVDGYIEAFLRYADLEATVSDFAHPGVTGLSKAGNIRLLIERNEIERAVMIGDTVLDYAAACEAGVPFIHAAYGFGQVAQAEWHIGAISALPALLREIGLP